MKLKKLVSLLLVLMMLMSALTVTAEGGATNVLECGSYTTSANGQYYEVDLDNLITTGHTYEFSWNVKPSSLGGSKDLFVDVAGGDIVVQNQQGQRFGLLYIYDSGNHALGLGDWNKIGSISGYKSSILADGVDMTILWNTETGSADITAVISGREYQYTWNPGVISGTYGTLKIGADSTTVTITDLVVADLTVEQGGGGESDELVFTEENGWNIGSAQVHSDGRLEMSDTVRYTPTILDDMEYTITFDVTGLNNPGGTNDWTYQYRLALSAGDVELDGYLSYRMAGIWENAHESRVVAGGTDGTIKVTLNSRTGEYQMYALGNLATSGTLEDLSDFTLKMYRWGGNAPYISNFRIVADELTDYAEGLENGFHLNHWKYDEENEQLKLVFDIDEESACDVYIALVDGSGAEVVSQDASLSNTNYRVTLDAVELFDSESYTLHVWDSQITKNDLIEPIDLSKRLVAHSITGEVDIHSDLVNEYLDDTYDSANNYANGNVVADKPYPVTVSWSYEKAAVEQFVVKVSESPDLSNAWEFTTDSLYCDIYNVKVGTTYYWNVTAEYTDGTTDSSDVKSFTVENQAPRMIFADGVPNMRDLGGRETANGHTVAQGLIYRSAAMDNNNVAVISQEGIDTMRNQLGINTEIEFRYENVDGKTESILGSDVNYYHYSMGYGDDMLDSNAASIKGIFEAFADSNNYPIVYHCQVGADRTGLISYLLNGLLGVPKEELLRDYLLTNFSTVAGSRDLSMISDKYVRTLAEYNGDTLACKIYNYLHREIGVSAEDLDAIIANMGCEKYGTEYDNFVPSIYTPENGWTVAVPAEQDDGSLKMAGDVLYNPNLDANKKYSVKFDVSGLEAPGGDQEWTYQFRLALKAGGETVDGSLSYRMAGIWENGNEQKWVASGTEGTIEVIIDMETGDYQMYALGALSAVGTLADTSDFTLKMYKWGGKAPYISNVTITELWKNQIYTPQNGWTAGTCTEYEDGSLLFGSEGAIFQPDLDSAKKYAITYNISGLEIGGGDYEWTYSFLVDLLGGSETAERVLSYRMGAGGRWNQIVDDTWIANGTEGENKIIIDMATGEWESYTMGNLSQKGQFADTTDFAIKFYRWGGNPATISNVTITEIIQTAEVPVVTDANIQLTKFDGTVSSIAPLVSAGTEQLTIKFDTKMLPASLTDTAITLTKQENGESVACLVDKTAYSYTMTFSDLLEPGCTYVLQVADTIKNIEGESLAAPYSYTFTTDAGGFEFSLKGISVSENTQPSLSDVLGANSLTVDIDVMNSTAIGKNMLLIVTYYKGEELLYAHYDEFMLDASYRNTTVSRVVNVTPPTGTDNVQIFLWDGVTTMKSYDKELVVR